MICVAKEIICAAAGWPGEVWSNVVSRRIEVTADHLHAGELRWVMTDTVCPWHAWYLALVQDAAASAADGVSCTCVQHVLANVTGSF